MKKNEDDIHLAGRAARSLGITVILLLMLIAGAVAMLWLRPAFIQEWFFPTPSLSTKANGNLEFWSPPLDASIPAGAAGEEIRYGRALIAHTSEYLGPKGTVAAMSNGMNCQNCHLEAGTKVYGNNYSAVASTYPKFRTRSGTNETIQKRINDCFERSLNGRALAAESREMKAIVAYITWLGTGTPKGASPLGSGLVELAFLDRAANPDAGKRIYMEKCVVCHGVQGEGASNATGTGWTYPPLWGDDSYNVGAGLYRLSRFAGYVKTNMPLGATYEAPLLTDEEAWDVAAFVNSMPHPDKDISADWPDITKKPIDHPFGPFADGFGENQHKFGPFKPVQMKRKQMTQN